jgi:predicted DNA-binding transcriptional regulator YafY
MMELCGEERITAAGDGQFLVDFPFVPDEFGYNLLLGFGDKCECVGPAEVREELARRVRRMASLYKL